MRITRKESHKEVKFPALATYKGGGNGVVCIVYNRGGGNYRSIALHDGNIEDWEDGELLNSKFEFLPVDSVIELKQSGK